ncbi:MAG: hypothetical protein ACRDZ4_17530, partial [Egibacteraceae bacterium]
MRGPPSGSRGDRDDGVVPGPARWRSSPRPPAVAAALAAVRWSVTVPGRPVRGRPVRPSVRVRPLSVRPLSVRADGLDVDRGRGRGDGAGGDDATARGHDLGDVRRRTRVRRSSRGR